MDLFEYRKYLRFNSPNTFRESNNFLDRKNIIIIIITSLLSIYFGFSKKSKLENSNKILLLFFFIISVLSYKTALGRSDGPHLKTAMFFSYITLAFIMFINLGYYLEKRFYQNKALKTFKYISYLFL